jgi:hypothetical protein
MSIRHGVFRIGETVEITAIFTNTVGVGANNISGGKLIIKKPPNPDGSLGITTTLDIFPVDGVFTTDISPDVIGTWKVRIECTQPSPTTREGHFEVVDSMVVPILPYSFY